MGDATTLKRAWVALVCVLLLAGCDNDSAPMTADAGPDLDAADAPPDAGGGDPIVTLGLGGLRGFYDAGSHGFIGVPYAVPPLVELRWTPPVPVDAWEGVRDATTLASPCVQPIADYLDEGDLESASMGDEDCLYLNVWTPADRAPDAALPVLVFLHGGGNVYGSTAEPLSAALSIEAEGVLYDGARLAARGDVVVVTVNYRLGVLGYLTHAFLDAANDTGTSGNYGLMDQILALAWVQDHIAAFGGDPERVLLFGQSGGGRDVTLLATSPLTEGLFAAVAIHSAPLGAPTQADVRARAQELVEELGCEEDTLYCMQHADPHEMVTAEASRPVGLANAAFLPTLDGYVVVDQPRTIVATGAYRGTPILLGTNDDEYSHRWQIATEDAYRAAVAAMIGPAYVDDVLAQYPVSRFGSATEAFTEAMSDRNVSCPHVAFAQTLAGAGYDAWLYRFRQVLPAAVREGYGAYHTSELVYLFQHLDGDSFVASDEDRSTQAWMADLWTWFAGHGSFDSYEALTWPAFDLTTQSYLAIDAAPQVAERLKQDDCAFWASLR